MTKTKQGQLPGGRTSANVPKGTSPVEAARAARASTTNVKAPGAVKGKGGKGGRAAAAMGEYDTLAAQPGEAGGGMYVGDASDVQAIPGFGELRPGESPAWDAAMAQAMREVQAKHLPQRIEPGIDAQGRAMMPGGDGSLVNKFRAVFGRDARPDVPLTPVTAPELDARSAYMTESQRIAEAMMSRGRPRDSSGRFAKSVTVTTHGAVQVRGADGRIRETLRAPYRASATGRIGGNIEAPITTDETRLREAVDARLKAYGESLFQDRAGLTPRRLAAMRLAFAIDRKERGWPIPDWGLAL